jgi:D-psicose/D-tagatose/L-ribulose 3-epimerase
MKLAVSNIAWEPDAWLAHLTLLRTLGCEGIELAPSVLWAEPVEATPASRAEIRRQMADAGLTCVGFHALFFTRPDLELFKDAASRREMVSYLTALAHLAGDLGAGVLVVGSPRNRTRHGRPYADALPWAADAYREAAVAAAPAGVEICIEPLPSKETEFIVSSDEGAALVSLVNHPAFGLHLDAKAMVEQGEDIEGALARHGRAARHFHVGDPGLAPPGSTGLDHAPIGAALRRSGYDRWVSIEMRRGFGPSADVIRDSVQYTRRCYFGVDA